MGLNVSCIIVDSYPNSDKPLLNPTKISKIKLNKIRLKSLNPEKLSFAFVNGCTIILLDKIYYKNIDENEELTLMEKDLTSIFPNSKILLVTIFDTIDFLGYSFLNCNVKVRTKVTVKDTIFLDYGELQLAEQSHYEMITHFIDNQTNRKIANFKKILSDHTELEFKKSILSVADDLLDQYNSSNPNRYQSGSLDEIIIDEMISEILGIEILNLLNTDVFEFERKRINFKTDSLNDFVLTAYQKHITTNA